MVASVDPGVVSGSAGVASPSAASYSASPSHFSFHFHSMNDLLFFPKLPNGFGERSLQENGLSFLATGFEGFVLRR